jgi:hypothetical protein
MMQNTEDKTLRDEFAMAALNIVPKQMFSDYELSYHEVAGFAYQLADAMMKERLK